MDVLTREQRQQFRQHITVAELLVQPRQDGRTVASLREWSAILGRGVPEIVEISVSPDERACELKVSPPFAGYWTPRSEAGCW